MSSIELKNKILEITLTNYEIDYEKLDINVFSILEDLVDVIENNQEEIKKLKNPEEYIDDSYYEEKRLGI